MAVIIVGLMVLRIVKIVYIMILSQRGITVMIEDFKQIFMSIKTVLPVSSLAVVIVSLVSLWINILIHFEEFEHPEIPLLYALIATFLSIFWLLNLWL